MHKDKGANSKEQASSLRECEKERERERERMKRQRGREREKDGRRKRERRGEEKNLHSNILTKGTSHLKSLDFSTTVVVTPVSSRESFCCHAPCCVQLN